MVFCVGSITFCNSYDGRMSVIGPSPAIQSGILFNSTPMDGSELCKGVFGLGIAEKIRSWRCSGNADDLDLEVNVE